MFNILRLLITANSIAYAIRLAVLLYHFLLGRMYSLGVGSRYPFFRVLLLVCRTTLVDCISSKAQSLCNQEILSYKDE